MKKGLIISGVFALLVALTGLTYYFAVQIPAKKLAEIELEKAKLVAQEAQIQQDKEARLNNCLEEAKERTKASFELNSYPAPQEGYPDARRWDSIEIRTKTEETYNSDREFCLERYK